MSTPKMSVVLSFIGNMPPYIYECLKQLRLFYQDDIYLIYSIIAPELKTQIETFNPILISYDTVISSRFNNTCSKRNYAVVDKLNDRKLLFMRSFERFYLLDELIKQRNLKYIWFMELDILMYTSPNTFIETLKDIPTAFAYHRTDHCNSGIFYVKDTEALQPILTSFDNFTEGFISEMRALFAYSAKIKHESLFFPLVIKSSENRLYWKDIDLFNGYLFDGAILGMYYFGIDPIHTNGKIITNNKHTYDMDQKFLNIWKYGDLIWQSNQDKLQIPYFKLKESEQLIPVANLHIHSKDLKSAVSYR